MTHKTTSSNKKTLEYHMKLGSQISLITTQTDEKLGEEEKIVGQIGDTTPFTILYHKGRARKMVISRGPFRNRTRHRTPQSELV